LTRRTQASIERCSWLHIDDLKSSRNASASFTASNESGERGMATYYVLKQQILRSLNGHELEPSHCLQKTDSQCSIFRPPGHFAKRLRPPATQPPGPLPPREQGLAHRGVAFLAFVVYFFDLALFFIMLYIFPVACAFSAGHILTIILKSCGGPCALKGTYRTYRYKGNIRRLEPHTCVGMFSMNFIRIFFLTSKAALTSRKCPSIEATEK
jgi:hypothetical protein